MPRIKKDGTPAKTPGRKKAEAAPFTGDLALVAATVQGETEGARHALAAIEALPVETAEQYAFLGNLVQIIAQKHDEIDAIRTSITAPQNEALRAANDLFRPFLGLAKDCETKARAKIAAFVVACEQRRRELLKEADLTARMGDQAGAAALSQEAGGLAVPTLPGLTVTLTPDIEITDPNLIPREFMQPNLEAIKVYLSQPGAVAIPGTREVSKAKIVANRQGL